MALASHEVSAMNPLKFEASQVEEKKQTNRRDLDQVSTLFITG